MTTAKEKTETGAPQRRVLGPATYFVYTGDIPHQNSKIATFADEKGIFVDFTYLRNEISFLITILPNIRQTISFFDN